jgi:hypothetical protein
MAEVGTMRVRHGCDVPAMCPGNRWVQTYRCSSLWMQAVEVNQCHPPLPPASQASSSDREKKSGSARHRLAWG